MIIVNFLALLFVCGISTSTYAQTPRYEGSDVIVDAPPNGGLRAVRFAQPLAVNERIIVSIAPTFLTACHGSTITSAPLGQSYVNANTSTTSGYFRRWCFDTTKPFTLAWSDSATSKSYSGLKWLPESNSTGFYNVKDFGATGDGTTDDTNAVENALLYAAAKTGGTVYIPAGKFKIQRPLTLPSGVILQGSHGRTSSGFFLGDGSGYQNETKIVYGITGSDPVLFRIGEIEENIHIKNIELFGNGTTSSIGVDAVGWEATAEGSTTQTVSFEGVVFTNFDKGIYVHNRTGSGCPPCDSWQFDYVKVDHCRFEQNKVAGIYIDTFNTDWKIANTFFDLPPVATSAADGIYINKAGDISLDSTFGGGFGYGSGKGGDFLDIQYVGRLQILGSGCESTSASIRFSPAAATLATVFTLVGSTFGDPIILDKPLTYVSTGNFYLGRNVTASDSSINIYSMGDRFCYGSSFGSGACGDGTGAIGFQGSGRVIYQTGQPKDGTVVDQINTKFGLPVQLAGLDWPAISALSSPSVGTVVWCTNCTVSACSTSGSGALAVYTGSAWSCK